MKTVVIGFLGSTLDAGGQGAGRWEKWRPSVSLCQQEDLLIDRFELLHPPDLAHAAAQLAKDIASVSPETQVVLRPLPLGDPWDFEQVYGALHELARTYPFDPESEDYLVHITTGTHVAQICMFLLTESRHFPGRLVQTSPGQGPRYVQGAVQIVDLDLSRYDAIASRFREEQKEAASFLKSGIPTRNAAFNRLIDRIFGHVKGSFTGALRDRPGLLRAANRGVLFLDEIGELGLDEQAMLLRALPLRGRTPALQRLTAAEDERQRRGPPAQIPGKVQPRLESAARVS